MQLKCTKDNNGYYEVGKVYDVDEYSSHTSVIYIRVNAGYANNKEKNVGIHCTAKEFKDKFIRNSDAEFIIIDD